MAQLVEAQVAVRKLLEVRGLDVRLPGGMPLFLGLDLDVQAGSVVTIVGGSGAGKTTLLRALFERELLEQSGYAVSSKAIQAFVPLGLVPQHGAPFDHLDAAGNIRLALRHADPPHDDGAGSVEACLVEVDLPRSWAAGAVDVSRLSGGQAQRLAVARTLAGGRKLLFMDEPSAGLDPYRVQLLARQLRALCAQGAGIVLVTHDIALASASSDRILLLGPKGLTDAFAGKWPGALEGLAIDDLEKARYQQQLERRLVEALTVASSMAPDGQGGQRQGRFLANLVEPLGVATVAAISQAPALRFPKDYAHVFGRVVRLAVLAPALFYAVVSTLLGFTILFLITHVAPEGVNPSVLVRQIGGSYVTALAPALSAFLFVAASGNSVNAWLGGMGLTRQIAALEALGIKRERYLWAPAWLALAVGYLTIAVVFAFGLLVGGLLLCRLDGIPDGWVTLSSDLIDPRPGRGRFLVRALWLVLLYAGGIAADVVAKASREKPSAESVTQGMTASVVTCTLWVVVLELGSALWLFSSGPHG